MDKLGVELGGSRVQMNKFGLEEQEVGKDLLSYYWWKGGFSAEECERALSVCRKYEREEATVFGNDERSDGKIRKSTIRWIPNDGETSWIFEKLSHYALEANRENFRVDISGFTEDIQFTEYEGTGSHYDWHPDVGPGKNKRKISITVQLNDDYEGGELQINPGMPVTAEKGRGNVIVFPSVLLHKVNPIVRGNRYSLVSWISGPVWR